MGLIPGSGRSPGEGNGKPLQYSCLENPMDRGASQAAVHRVTKSWTQLSTHACHYLMSKPIFYLMVISSWLLHYLYLNG